MSIVIEQTQDEIRDSHTFSRRADIAGVKFSSAAFSAPRALPQELDETLSVGIRFAPQDAPTADGCVRATTFFECVITEVADSEGIEPVAKFECSLVATYHLHEGYVPTEPELIAFHKANAIFNCWPYFREFIQSAACRMNIPPPPVPFLRVQVVPKSAPSVDIAVPRKRAKKILKASV